MPRKQPSLAIPGMPSRGRGRPSKAELALRAEVLRAGIPAPPEPTAPPVMPPAPPVPPPPPPPVVSSVSAEDLDAWSGHLAAAKVEDLPSAVLREFAWKRGISRSEMGDMSDEKVREQLKILLYRQHEYV